MNLQTLRLQSGPTPADPATPRAGWSLIGVAAAALLAGCTALQGGVDAQAPSFIPPPLFAPLAVDDSGSAAPGSAPQRNERRTQLGSTPQVPDAARLSTVKPGSAAPTQPEAANATLAFDQLPLPTFIQVVFGNILKASYSVDPAVMTRADLVTLRTGQPQTNSQVLETTRLLLKSYGVAVIDMGAGVYRIVPDSNQSAYLPEIRRGRAQPDVPLPLRPVFNLVEMSAVRHTDVGNWLKAMFGARLNVQEDAARNALLLSGQAADLTAALEAIQVLDQPLMRARSSQLISPSTLGADDLARRLVEILTAEGYAAGTGAATGLPISLVPIPASNSLLVFAVDRAVLAHVTAWATKLDSLENDNRRSGNYFSYEVKYADAQALAKTMQELMSAQATTSNESTQLTPGLRVIGAPVQRTQGRFVVNAATNTLIFSTSNPDEYSQLLGIMKSLDKPAKSALIEVTVAEVRLGDSSQLGIEWNFGPDAAGKGSVLGGTTGGLALGTAGLTLSYLNSAGQVRAKLNALASDNRARILSTPRVMARNGETASIQVGQEVPIVTSQQSTNTGVGGAPGGVLQTIQYRSTGVILRVKPIIFAGRVELDVQQEVSSAAATSTGVNVSPTFSTRKVDTKLSIRDGATVALGGLISRNETSGQTGVPLLKDLPLLGNLFRTDTMSGDQTELIILITPYVVENDLVAEQVTQAMRSQLGTWARPGSAVNAPFAPSSAPSLMPPAGPARPLPADMLVPASVAPTSIYAPPVLQPDAVSGAPAPGPAISSTPAAGAAPLQQPREVLDGVVPPSGRLVTDPALLEALRRAGLQPAGAAPQLAPVVKPAVSDPASPKRARTPKAKPVPVRQ